MISFGALVNANIVCLDMVHLYVYLTLLVVFLRGSALQRFVKQQAPVGPPIMNELHKLYRVLMTVHARQMSY